MGLYMESARGQTGRQNGDITPKFDKQFYRNTLRHQDESVSARGEGDDNDGDVSSTFMAELEEPVAKREVPFAEAEAADKRRSNEEMMGKRRGQFAPIEIERREQGKRGGRQVW